MKLKKFENKKTASIMFDRCSFFSLTIETNKILQKRPPNEPQ
jgi:hypothetical protein